MHVSKLSAATTAQLSSAPFTYDAVGATAGELPAGFRVTRRARTLPGTVTFDAAAAALLSWRMHTNVGMRVAASSDTVESGGVVVLGVGIGRLRLSAPCRVVYVITEERQRGFAYGTLPGHPEGGEERFVVEQQPDGRVEFRIVAFSRPASALARLGGPLTRRVQDLMTRRYLRALDV